MNWLSRIIANYRTRNLRRYDYILATQLLQSQGLTGMVSSGISSLIQACNNQHVAILKAQSAITETDAAINKIVGGQSEADGDEYTYLYLIPYDVTKTQHWNGGPAIRMNGEAVINLVGGIKNWQNILGVKHFIATTYFSDHPNVSIRINGIFELNKWRTEP